MRISVIVLGLLLFLRVDARKKGQQRQLRLHEESLRRRIQRLENLLNEKIFNSNFSSKFFPEVSNTNGRLSKRPSSYHEDPYTPWSSWSKCNRRCKQRRSRACQTPSVCQNSVLKERRSCTGGRCRKRKFVVKPIKTPRNRGRHNTSRILRKFNERIYSKWSDWSPCTRRCTTRRYRSCKFEMFCGKNVLQETAYCYVRGSACEKWYIEQKSPNSANPQEQWHLEQKPATSETSYVTARPPKINRRYNFRSSNNSHSLNTTSVHHHDQCGKMKVNYPETRIIGGKRAPRGKWSWQVAILNRFQEVFCGGTLIAPQWVLTAAHCLRKKLQVRLGEHDLLIPEGSEREVKVHAMFTHPEYDEHTVDNDIALLQLRNVQDNKQFPCLPTSQDTFSSEQLCTIIGWGKERHTHLFGTTVLREAQVPIVSFPECRNVYRDYLITKNMVCAGYPRGQIDSCAGDSGGPLLCKMDDRWTVMGITSFGEGCGRKGKYGIYARVPNYVRWIRKILRKHTIT